jgi:hypothetical protein
MMWRAAVFEEKNALPGSQLHFSIDNWHGLARARQHHADVRWHIVTTLGAVRKELGIFRDKAIEEFLEIASRRGVGILHDDNAATSVLNKDGHRPIAYAAFSDPRLHIVSDFVQPFAFSANFEFFMMNAHCDAYYSGGAIRAKQ